MTALRDFTSLSLVLGGAALAASLLVTVPASAAGGDAITACVGPGGQITHAAVGHEPKRRCPPNHVQETWALSGEQGPPGISCWDLDEDGVADPDEDFNKDGFVDVLDCRPAEVYQQPAARTWYVASGALLFASAQADPSGPWADPTRRLPLYSDSADCLLNVDPACVADPVPDPCGLWYWAEESEGRRYLKAARGYQYSVQTLQDYNSGGTEDPTDDSFGWENCLAGCLADGQCVGASITESGEEALACRLIAKTQFEDPIVDEYDHLGPRTLAQWAPILYGMENNFLTAIRNTVISVCPIDTP